MTTSIYNSKKPIGKIYLTTNTINGLQYVGQTQCLSCKTYKGSGKLLKEAFKEFGKNNFLTILLEYVYCRSQLDPLEIKWITEKNTLWPNGYNLTGGGGYHEVVKETKQKISASLTGKKLSDEHKHNISKGITGKKHSEETKSKISIKNKGRKVTEETKKKISISHVGMKHSEEAKKNMSDAKKGRKLTEEAKKNMSAAHVGMKLTEETKQNISKAKKGIKQKQVTCPHCEKVGGISAMKQHHFVNCKMKGK